MSPSALGVIKRCPLPNVAAGVVGSFAFPFGSPWLDIVTVQVKPVLELMAGILGIIESQGSVEGPLAAAHLFLTTCLQSASWRRVSALKRSSSLRYRFLSFVSYHIHVLKTHNIVHYFLRGIECAHFVRAGEKVPC